MDKCRRIIAYNTLKAWQKLNREKSERRSTLMEGRMKQLGEEEEKTNELLAEY